MISSTPTLRTYVSNGRLADHTLESYSRDLQRLGEFAAGEDKSLRRSRPSRPRTVCRRPHERGPLAALGGAHGGRRQRVFPLRRARAAPQRQSRRRSPTAPRVAGAAEVSRPRRGRAPHQATRRHDAARVERSRADRGVVRDGPARHGARPSARQRLESRCRLPLDHRQRQQTAHRADWRRGFGVAREIHSRGPAHPARQAQLALAVPQCETGQQPDTRRASGKS